MTHASRIENAVFLVGAERSGSTLLSHMLDHHPQIAWCRGFEFAVTMVQQNERWPRPDDYRRYLKTDRVFQTSGYTIDSTLGYVDLIHDFLRQERETDGKPLVGATVHLHFDRLSWLFPGARYIHLLRDGRDAGRSCIAMGWAGNMWMAMQRWMDAESLWDELHSRLTSRQFHEVRYEALIDAPETTLREICDFIGVPYASQMLGYPADTGYASPDRNLINQWASLPPREIRLAQTRAAPMLQARGYPLSGLPPVRVGWLYHQWLREQDRFRRIRFRVQRNGLMLVASDLLARHLRLDFWAQRVQLRLNAIEVKHLK